MPLIIMIKNQMRSITAALLDAVAAEAFRYRFAGPSRDMRDAGSVRRNFSWLQKVIPTAYFRRYREARTIPINSSTGAVF